MRLPGLFGRLKAAVVGVVHVGALPGLDFFWAEGFVFSHVADEGIINACTGYLLWYRKQIGAENIQIFADIKKKHSLPAVVLTAGKMKNGSLNIRQDGQQTCVLTVTTDVKHAVKIPVMIGSGMTEECEELLGCRHSYNWFVFQERRLLGKSLGKTC